MAKTYDNRWETVESLSEGGQAQTFVVRDLQQESTETFVLKRLKNPKRLDRFEQEIKAGQQLNHPQIAPIVDFSIAADKDKHSYFVTKHYVGKTLDKKAPLEPLQALKIFIEICDVVAYAHTQGIVHRDLKPENIILDENDKPVILDFGICYFVDEGDRLTETMEQVGSRYYIAPELEGGRSTSVTKAVDSYALGKILYFLISSTIFSRENYTGANELSARYQNPQLDYISKRILAASVAEEPTQRISVEKLKQEAITISRLIKENFYPGTFNSRCRFCGEGTYKKMRNTGLKVFNRYPNGSEELYKDFESIRCDKCGNTQWFDLTGYP